MAHIITSRTCFGFMTSSMAGEVFFAAYHPQGTFTLGMNTNIELNEYLCNLFGLTHEKLGRSYKQELRTPHGRGLRITLARSSPAADGERFSNLDR